MPNQSNSIFVLTTLVFFVISLFFGIKIVNHTLKYKNLKEVYAQSLNFESRLLDFEEWFDKEGKQEAKLKQAEVIIQEAIENKTKGQQYAWYFGVLALLYLGAANFLFAKGDKRAFRLTVALVAIGLSSLIVGLFAPMLEIGAYEREMSIPVKLKPGAFPISVDFTQNFAGDMYFYYQSKSVVELIQILFEQKNFLVGISILLFSILIPVGKLSLSFLALFRRSILDNRFVSLFIHKSGKWSMADVFVVAVFLSFLAFTNMQTGITTDSNVLLGLYFFFTYVVLAILISITLGRLEESTTVSS